MYAFHNSRTPLHTQLLKLARLPHLGGTKLLFGGMPPRMNPSFKIWTVAHLASYFAVESFDLIFHGLWSKFTQNFRRKMLRIG